MHLHAPGSHITSIQACELLLPTCACAWCALMFCFIPGVT